MRKILILTIEEIKEAILYDVRAKGYKPVRTDEIRQTSIVKLICDKTNDNIEAHIEVESLDI